MSTERFLILSRCFVCNLTESAIERLPIGEAHHIGYLLYTQVGIARVLQQRHSLFYPQPIDKLREIGMITHTKHYRYVARIGVQKRGKLLGRKHTVAVSLLHNYSLQNLLFQFVKCLVRDFGKIGRCMFAFSILLDVIQTFLFY